MKSVPGNHIQANIQTKRRQMDEAADEKPVERADLVIATTVVAITIFPIHFGKKDG
ncbi:MAG: hypothetical protein V2B18_19115 [Pseudomonadota bacterium]